MDNCEYVKENISAFLDNELNEDEKKLFLEHLDECEDCEKEFLLIEKLIRSLDNIEEIELPENFHSELMKKLNNESEKIVNNKNEDNIISLPADKKYVLKSEKRNKFNFRKYIPAFGAVAAIFIVAIIFRNIDLVNKSSDSGMAYETGDDNQAGSYSVLDVADSSPKLEISDRMIVAESSIATNLKQAKEIQEYNIEINVENFDEALLILDELDGYNSYSSMDSYDGSVSRNISISRIVNQDKANEILIALESLGEVTTFSKSVRRLTFELLNIQGQIDANDTEINNLKELFKNSKSIDAMSYIEQRLYEIYHEQNNLKGELDSYTENTETAKFIIEIKENKESVTSNVTSRVPFKQELSETFNSSLNSAIGFASDIILVIAGLWLPLAIIAIVLIIVKVVKNSKGGKKNEKI